MLESERRSTETASQLSIEEVYIDSDATLVNEGYQFDFPYQFNADDSQNKLIGIRRLSLTPGNYTFDIGIRVYPQDALGYEILDDESTAITGKVSPLYNINVTSKNTVEEILFDLSSKLQLTGTFKGEDGFTHTFIAQFVYHFDQRTGSLMLLVTQTFGLDPPKTQGAAGAFYSNERYYPFFQFTFSTGGTDKDHFLSFLNNKPTDALKASLIAKQDAHEFRNVWNRSSLSFHSTFSSSHRNYIGRMGDSWNIPSKLYKYPYGCGNFTIWTTTDGVHKLVIVDSELTVELCYVLNYKNNLSI